MSAIACIRVACCSRSRWPLRARRQAPTCRRRRTPTSRPKGIPPIPAALAAKVAPYTEFRPGDAPSLASARSASSSSRRRAGNTAQLIASRRRGDEPAQLTDFAEPVRFGALVAEGARHAGVRARRRRQRAAAALSARPGRRRSRCCSPTPTRKHEVARGHACARLGAASTRPTSTRPAAPREPDARPHAASIRSIRPKPRKHRHAAGHRLGRLLVLVRRPAARDDRVQVGQRDLRVGDGRRDRRAAARAAGGEGATPAQPIASSRPQFRARRQGPVPDDRPRRRIPQARLPRPRDAASSTPSATAATGTSRRSRCRPTAARSPSSPTRRGVGVLRLYDADDAPRAAAAAAADRRRARTRVAREFARPRRVGQQRAEPRRRVRDRRARQRRHALDRDARSRVSTRRSSASAERDRMEELRRPHDQRLHRPGRRRSSPASAR